MKKTLLIAAAAMLATGTAFAQTVDGDDVNTPMDGIVSPSNTPAKSAGTGPMEADMRGEMDDDMMEDDMAMPPVPPTALPAPPVRTTPMPPQQMPRIQYERSPMPAGAATPSVPGGDYPVCTRERTDNCKNPGGV